VPNVFELIATDLFKTRRWIS